MTTTRRSFYLPTIPYSLIDAANRAAAATGSTRYAQASEGADYNGHVITFEAPNPFVRYWRAGYMWSGFNVIARGTLDECLAAARRYYAQGARGSSVKVSVTTDEDAAACVAAGMVEGTDPESFHDARFEEVWHAMKLESSGLLPGAVGLLVNSTTLDEYRAKVEAAFAARRARLTV